MTVKELIKELKKFNPDQIVVQSGYEGGYCELDGVSPIKLKLNVNTECYYGAHEQDDNGDCDAVYIG